MATHASAKKRFLQSEKRRLRNRSAKSAMNTQIKKAKAEIANKTAQPGLGEMRLAQKAIAITARKGIISKQKAARRISRLMKQANQQKQAAAA